MMTSSNVDPVTVTAHQSRPLDGGAAEGARAGGGGVDPTKPFLDPAKILSGTPEELMPYQQKLADEYVEASLALKAAGTTAKPQ